MKKPDTAIKLLTLAEAATILKISKRTLHRMIQNRQIPAFKVGGMHGLVSLARRHASKRTGFPQVAPV